MQKDPQNAFYGEVGVNRHIPHIKSRKGWLDEDYDRTNPDGMAWGRRNYRESSYMSGTPQLEPSEYRVQPDFYASYRLDEERHVAVPGDRPDVEKKVEV